MKLSHFALGGLFLLLGAGLYLTIKTDMDGRLDDLKAENEQKWDRYERAQREQAALLQKSADALKDMKKTAEGPVTAPAPLPKADNRKVASAPVPQPESPADDIIAAAEARAAAATAAAKKAINKSAPEEIADAPPDLVAPPPDPAINPEDAKIRRQERDLLNSPGVANDRMDIEDGKIRGDLPKEGGSRLTTMQSRIVSLPAIARVKEVKESDGFVILDRGQNANLAKGDKFSVRCGTLILGPVTVSDTVLATECVADVGQLFDGAVVQKGDEVVKWVR